MYLDCFRGLIITVFLNCVFFLVYAFHFFLDMNRGVWFSLCIHLLIHLLLLFHVPLSDIYIYTRLLSKAGLCEECGC